MEPNINDTNFWSRGGDGGGWNPQGNPFKKEDGPMAAKLKQVPLGKGGKTIKDMCISRKRDDGEFKQTVEAAMPSWVDPNLSALP